MSIPKTSTQRTTARTSWHILQYTVCVHCFCLIKLIKVTEHPQKDRCKGFKVVLATSTLATDEYLCTCHFGVLHAHPSRVLCVQSPSPQPAWVMACVDFLSVWAVLLHGSPLSSCSHACPFKRPGNPSWYLYRPWFSWCAHSLLPSFIRLFLPLLFLPSLSSLSFPFLIMCNSLKCHYLPIHFAITFPHPENPQQFWNCQKTSELGSVLATNELCMVKQHESTELVSTLMEEWLVYRWRWTHRAEAVKLMHSGLDSSTALIIELYDTILN